MGYEYMKLYVMSFVYVSFILIITYAVMRTLSKASGESKKKKTIYFIIFFGICALLYTFRWNTQNRYNEKIQDYLYKIEQSIEIIYDKLDGTNLLGSIEDELWDINDNIQEIYSIINN